MDIIKCEICKKKEKDRIANDEEDKAMKWLKVYEICNKCVRKAVAIHKGIYKEQEKKRKQFLLSHNYRKTKAKKSIKK